MAATIIDLVKRRIIPAGPMTRPIPYSSGEGAIYTPEYLERKEGNAKGAQPQTWRWMHVPSSWSYML